MSFLIFIPLVAGLGDATSSFAVHRPALLRASDSKVETPPKACLVCTFPTDHMPWSSLLRHDWPIAGWQVRGRHASGLSRRRPAWGKFGVRFSKSMPTDI